jgi:hypothetical protein
MKQSPIRLARSYVSALRKHLLREGSASLAPASRLGHRTVALGLKKLDLARIHDQALATLPLPAQSPGKKVDHAARAGIFFAEANAPLEKHQRASGRSEADFIRLEAALRTRTRELAAAVRQCEQGVARRKAMEEANEKRRVLHKQCLDESLQLQKRLRWLTHRILAAQEDDHKTISRQLQNEVAQTLLGINVRLVTLQKEARGRTKRFKKDIASTQQAVDRAALTGLRPSGLPHHRTCGFPHPAVEQGGSHSRAAAKAQGMMNPCRCSIWVLSACWTGGLWAMAQAPRPL